MTDKEKIELKDGVINIFNRFNTLDNTATIGGLRDDILRYIDSLQEELVSEDLGDYINELSKQFPEVSFAKLSRIAVRVAKWQEKQDQKVIELAEDHAMLAGMEKMKEEMMEKAIDCEVHQTNVAGIKLDSVEICSDGIMLDNTLYKEGDKVKVIVIKED